MKAMRILPVLIAIVALVPAGSGCAAPVASCWSLLGTKATGVVGVLGVMSTGQARAGHGGITTGSFGSPGAWDAALGLPQSPEGLSVWPLLYVERSEGSGWVILLVLAAGFIVGWKNS